MSYIPIKKTQRMMHRCVKIWHGIELYEYQKRITDAVIKAVIVAKKGITTEIPIEIPRQCGKTEAVVVVTQFLLTVSKRILKRPLRIGIFAPQTEQATTDFERLKSYFLQISSLGFRTSVSKKDDLAIPQKWNTKTIRLYDSTGWFLGEVYIFPLAKTSNPESKTLDVIIIEECQDVNDEKMKKSVFPMGASTNAPRIYIGTAGTRNCYFKRQIDTNKNLIKIELEEVFKQKQEAFEKTGDVFHMLYEKFVRHEIDQNGMDSDYIRTQYLLEWIIGSGQFTTADEIDSLVGNFPIITENTKRINPQTGKQDLEPFPCYFAIDSAKAPDSTIVTVGRVNTDRNKTEICNWLELQGENYEDQFEIIVDWLKPYENIRMGGFDSTGQGSFMPDKFERHTTYNVLPVKFTAQSKDEMYRNLQQVIKNKLTELPNDVTAKTFVRFREQMITLEKAYRGRLMSVHHPEGTDDNGKPFHDDYPDSWAILEHTIAHDVKSAPRISFF